MSDLIQHAQKRVRQYWTEDGLPDLYIGFGFLLYAGLTWWDAYVSLGWSALLRSSLLVVMVLLGRPLLKNAKERITYPRTGYVAYAQPPRRELAARIMLALAVAVVIALLILLLALGGESNQTFIPYLIPLAFAAIMGGVAYQQGSIRYALYAAIALLSGVAAVLFAYSLPPAEQSAVLNGAVMMVAAGGAMLLGGACALFQYLRRHPEPLESEA